MKQPPEELMIETPLGLLKWTVIRKALVRYEAHIHRSEQLREDHYKSYIKRMDTIARKKAEKEAKAKA